MVSKTALKHLPNAVYYLGKKAAWGNSAAGNILLLAALEIGSLHFSTTFSSENSIFYQLAFVLETQFYSVQTKLWVEIIFLLQYGLYHLGKCYILDPVYLLTIFFFSHDVGADFSLQCNWLHVKNDYR